MSQAYHSTEYLENQIETFKILFVKRDAEIASLRATQEQIRDSAFQLGRQASWDEAQETIERLRSELAVIKVLNDGLLASCDVWKELEAALRTELDNRAWAQNEDAVRIATLKAELDEVRAEGRRATASQDAEEIARLTAVLDMYAEAQRWASGTHAHQSAIARADEARAALACRPQGGKS